MALHAQNSQHLSRLITSLHTILSMKLFNSFALNPQECENGLL